MPSVFNIDLRYPLGHTLKYVTFVADMGDGFEQRVNKNLAYSRADGEGAVTSYKGQNEFSIRMNNLRHVNADATKEANKLWAFYKARLGAFESFYFYNPAEALVDLTGVATVGRYLVRFGESNLTREQFRLKLFSAGILLVEVRA